MPYCRVYFENVMNTGVQRDFKPTAKKEFADPVIWDESFTYISNSTEIGDVKVVFEVVNGGNVANPLNPLTQDEEVYGSAFLHMRQLKDNTFEGNLELSKDKGKSMNQQ